MSALSRIRDVFSGAPRRMSTMVHDGMQAMMGNWLFSSVSDLLSEARKKHNYAKDVGDGLNSSVLSAPLNWIMRTFPEAPPIVERFADGEWSPDPNHELEMLLETPNPYYGGENLFMATALDFTFGNAYWIKLRNSAGEVVQLWWAPRGTMTPRWESPESFIDYYQYRAGGQTFELASDDVVHFRFGLDPRNPRLGLSPLGALAREVGIDDLAAEFTAAILRNLGVIGVVVSPKEKGNMNNKQSVEEVKAYLKANFTGDKRGDALAVGAPTDVQLLQYNMEGFNVGPIRDVSEERVCAALGIPAAVVGFGTGLQQTKVGATMKEMRQLAWTGGIIPLQRMISKEIKRSLMPDFEQDAALVRLKFDTTQVRALWEDQNEKHDRVRKDWLAGGIMRSEYRSAIGLKFDKARDEVFVQPVNVVQLGPTGEPIPITQPNTPNDPNAPDTTDTTVPTGENQ